MTTSLEHRTNTDADRQRVVRSVIWRGWGSAMVGNGVAGTTIGIILAVSYRVHHPDLELALVIATFFEIAIPFFLVVSAVTCLVSWRLLPRFLRWYLEGRPASPQEVKDLASIPRWVVVINVVAWMFMTTAHLTYFTRIEHHSLPAPALAKTIAIYVFGFVLGTSLASLLLERTMRPYLQMALPDEIDQWPRSLGLGPRLVIAWFTVAGAPLVLIVLTWTGLTPDQMILGASALRITAGLAVVVGLVVFLLAGRTITGPLRRLQEAQQLVASGDLSPRVEVEEAGEIGHLEARFNQMVDGLTSLSVHNEALQTELRARLEEVQASRTRIVEAADAERARIERNLHDGAQQRLLSLSFALRSIERKVAGTPGVEEDVRTALNELNTAMAELRELARGIHPAILEEEGLGPALDSLAERAPVPVDVTTELPGRLPQAVEVTAYFVVAESIANIARYADATCATIRGVTDSGTLRLEIADDGRGGADPRSGSGLRGLTDRVAALGGTLTVESPVGQGTRILAVIPCA